MRAAWNNLAHLIASEKHSSILSFDLKTKAAALLSTMLSTHWWGELLLYDTPLSLSHSLSLFPSSLLLSVSCYKKPLAWAQGLYQEITGKCQWYSLLSIKILGTKYPLKTLLYCDNVLRIVGMLTSSRMKCWGVSHFDLQVFFAFTGLYSVRCPSTAHSTSCQRPGSWFMLLLHTSPPDISHLHWTYS